MRADVLSERAADYAAYQTYLTGVAGDDRAFREAFRAAFLDALRRQLTDRQYEVLWAHEVEGLSGKEIAGRMGISQSAVSRHLSRGRARLRVLLSYNLELRYERFSEQSFS